MKGAIFIRDGENLNYIMEKLLALNVDHLSLFICEDMKYYPSEIDQIYKMPLIPSMAAAENISDILKREGIDIVLGDTSKYVIMLLPYIAGLLQKEYIGFADDVEIREQGLIVRKKIFTGEYNINYLVQDTPLFVTIVHQRTGVNFRMERKDITLIDEGDPFYDVINVESKGRGEVDLEGADIIVSIGRGFIEREDIKLAEELAEMLGGTVGCSRPVATDLKWLPEERWIGLSGKKVEPKLYIAIGISGQSQHLAGIRKAKRILAINKDENAPIFGYTDYGVVADLYRLLPALLDRLRKEKG